MAPLVWLVTGSTSGIGEATVAEIVQRGDRVIAAGRQVEKRLGHLKSTNLQLLELDISGGFAEIQDRIREAWEVFGRIDVLFNNAGMSAMKSAEEADEKFVNDMFQVNLFGHMRVTQAILPFFRTQGHGRIAFTSSSTLWAPLPFMSHYAASKAALSAYVESLDKEVRPMGIRCVAIECGGFPTKLGQPRDASALAFGSNSPAIEEYSPLFGALVGKFATNPMVHMPGDLSKAAARIVDIIKQEGKAVGKSWAVRVALGSDGMGSAKQRCEEQLKLVEIWNSFSCSTDRGDQEPTAVQEMFEFTTVLGD
ncbi:NAD(P)-binding protein [Thozetella sp. PMI_491]|nr:NAD(P)-binding protein [Thozetella sp. PMI_491]